MRTAGLIDRFLLALLAAAAVGLLATGCASIETPSMPALPSLPNLPESLSSWQAKDETTESPKSLAVVWKTAVLQAPGATPTRGFGGIVTFYGPDRKTPIKVDGQLTVYVYEDSPRTSEKVAPDAKFVVPADQLAKQYKESPLGHAYSVWVPWDKAGGPKARADAHRVFRADRRRSGHGHACPRGPRSAPLGQTADIRSLAVPPCVVGRSHAP